MEFRQLRHFVAVAEAGNVTKAADDAFISQSALTRSIQSLEAEVGLSLFERTPKGIELTSEGVEFLPKARELLNGWSRTKSDLLALRKNSEGHLRVGVSTVFTRDLMAHALDGFLADHPTTSVTVMQGSFLDLRRDLLEGGYDFLLTADLLSPEPDERLSFEPLLDLEAAILASPNHPAVRKDNSNTAALDEQNWVFFDRSTDSNNSYLHDNGIHASRVAVRSNSISLIINLLETGNYLTVLSPQVCQAEIASGQLVIVKPLPGFVKRKIGLYSLSQRSFRSIEKSLIEHLRRNFDLSSSGFCVDRS